MDALHKQRLISANMATFLSNVNADLSRHDTMDQLRTGWLKYLKYDSTRASAGLVVPSSVESRFRRSLPISENADGGQNSPEAASAAGGGPGRAPRDRTPVTPSQDHAGQGADNSGSNSDRSFHPPTPHPILPIAFNHSVSVSHLNHPPQRIHDGESPPILILCPLVQLRTIRGGIGINQEDDARTGAKDK